jgi:membrane associated rhomboid family serine protease
MIPLKDTVTRGLFPLITWSIILLNFAVFFFEISLTPESLREFVIIFGVVPARLSQPGPVPVIDYLNVVSSMFIHGGWLHIIGNMWFFYLFGRSLEDRMGHTRFLAFYLLCGITAGATYIIFDSQSTVPSIGASGAIAGVMGAYILAFPTARILTLIPILFFPFFIEIPAFFFLGFWFLIQVISEAFSYFSHVPDGGVAWWAHIGGFITGMVLPFVFRRRKRPHQPDEFHNYVK